MNNTNKSTECTARRRKPLVSAQTQNASFLDTLDDDRDKLLLRGGLCFSVFYNVLFSRLSCEKDELFLSLKSNALSLSSCPHACVSES